MKQFAHINLEQVDINSIENLQLVKNNFLTHYLKKHALPKPFPNSHEIIELLSNYLKLSITPARTKDQMIALAICHLPQTYANENASINQLLKILHKHKCENLTFKELIEKFKASRIEYDALVEQEQTEKPNADSKLLDNLIYELDYMEDWQASTSTLWATITNTNYALALEALNKIAQATNPKKNIDGQILPHMLSLQIVYYIEILTYLHENIKVKHLHNFYTLTQVALKASLTQLQACPEIDVKPHGMFFYKHPKQNARVMPELLEPLLEASLLPTLNHHLQM